MSTSLTVCQFLGICESVCQLTQCLLAVMCVREYAWNAGWLNPASEFPSSIHVIHSQLLGNLIVSWHLMPILPDCLWCDSNNSGSAAGRQKHVSALIFPFVSCIPVPGLVTVTSAGLVDLPKPARHRHTAKRVVSRRLLDSSSPCSVENACEREWLEKEAEWDGWRCDYEVIRHEPVG